MAAEDVGSLFEKVRDAGLLDAERLAEVAALPEAADADPRVLGRVLVLRGYLTKYQVNQLALDRGRDLLVGPYELLDKVGEGGMGQVFKARHRAMNRTVALKIIRKARLLSPDAVRRFNQEVHAVAQLNHPNIVTAFDSGQVGHQHYLAMEYVDGIDLAQLVRTSGRPGVALACEYIRQAALGLQHAHQRGLVHRDVKPSNLLVQEGSDKPIVKILDMGLARLTGGQRDKGLTQSGQVVGTPDYLAPEQALNARTVDARADLYSLGGTLFFLLTGRTPFVADTLAEALLKHQMAEPPSLRKLRPEVPERLEAIVHRLLAKKPEDRFQTAAEVAKALAPFARGTNAEQTLADTVPPVTVKAASAPPGPSKPEAPEPGRPSEDAVMLQVVATRKAAKRPRPKGKDNHAAAVVGVCASAVLLVVLVVIGLVFSQRQPQGFTAGGPPAMPPAAPPYAASPGGIPPKPPDTKVPLKPGLPAATVAPDQPRMPEPKPPAPHAPPVPEPLPPPANTPLDNLDPAKIDAKHRHEGFAGLVAVLRGHSDEVWGVAFAPDGKSILTSAKNNEVRLWDVSGDKPSLIKLFPGVGGGIASVAFRPDGRQFAFGTVGSVQFCTLVEDGSLQSRLEGNIPAASMPFVAYGAGGRVLAVAGNQDVALLTYAGEVASPRRLRGHKGTPWGVSFSEDGRALAVSSDDNFVRVWDPATATARPKEIPTASRPTWPSLSPDGTSVAFGCFDGSVFCYALAGAKPRERWSKKAHTGWVTSVAFAPDGKTLVSTEGGEGRGFCVAAWWKADGTKIKQWPLPDRCMQAAFDATGRYLALTCHNANVYILRLPVAAE